MEIKFKELQYQLDAVNAVADCFNGQPKEIAQQYTIDQGKQKLPINPTGESLSLFSDDELASTEQSLLFDELHIGYANAPIDDLSKVLDNIRSVQASQGLTQSSELITDDTSTKGGKGQNLTTSPINLNIEMETGTGKTYCYIRSMMELNKRYGWSKFIIVVPSIAIREGVAKTFEMTADHFQEIYGKKPRSFVYNSDQLHELETFSSDASVNVMIINIQAFNSRSKSNRRIYDELDDFGSRRPIDVIRRNRPIVIIDEPQKLGSENALKSLAEFDPLFIMRYSATHKRDYNLIYRLDALDAYNQKLVKKITVKGIEVKGLSGAHGYLYLQNIEVSSSDPTARLDIEEKTKSGVKRRIRRVNKGSDLYALSKQAEQYKDRYVVAEIDAREQSLTFTNGIKIYVGQALGQIDETLMRTIQIRESIRAHLEKERVLFNQGLKVLSLFFIDEVAKYRQYDDQGNRVDGEYAQIFAEQYNQIVEDMIGLNIDNDPYIDYLRNIDVDRTHNGYFSVDKKSQQMIDPKTKNFVDEELGGKVSLTDDIDAYDLILKDKETLLSFPQPNDSEETRHKKNVRFIFSHSALREGWDNPNVFVICTLKHSENTISRRQEVGRGLRLAVRSDGMRMDANHLSKGDIHLINNLTVVTNESYTDFVTNLQKELAAALSSRPTKATKDYFYNKVLTLEDGSKHEVSERDADMIIHYLIKNDYIDFDKHITDSYHEAINNDSLAPLPEVLEPYGDQIIKLIGGIFDPKALEDMTDNDNKTTHNPINENNLKKKEFLALWNRINRKAVFEIQIDSVKLISQSIAAIEAAAKKRNNNFVETLSYKLAESTQRDTISHEELLDKQSFSNPTTSTESANTSVRSQVKYDLIGSISEQTDLTRRSIVAILKSINNAIFAQFKNNPEAFIREVARLINEARIRMVIQGLTYYTTDQTYPLNEVFVSNQKIPSDSLKVDRHVFDYVATDSSIEKRFAQELEGAVDDVAVYAKLPDRFKIPTPVGDYNPDWAIAFNEGKVRHIYFVAETKGSMIDADLREKEKYRIESAKRFFYALNSKASESSSLEDQAVKYDVIDSFDELLKLVR
ncbi:type III restriction-modification system endonuclease [Psychrobacter sp. Pi2-1]|uniref:type III restriction-modification system endonuclease n=1 Tax=Psychrobacter sp. Pi2-1 TaxID=2774131 RepID=UPI0019196B21|nr:DEAD/DEAH box helicase family protein [Psychrobacter sp. Pi2-1]